MLKSNLKSDYYCFNTTMGPLHIHIDYNEGGPRRIFAQVPPVGSTNAANAAIIGILLSKYFKVGGKPGDIIKHLFSVRGGNIGVWEGEIIESVPHAIGIALKAHVQEHAKGVQA